METEDLRACPFCGTFKGELTSDHYGYQIRCGECGAQGPQEVISIDALNGWNSRQKV